MKNLKMLRARKRISQQQLADMLGVSQQSVNKYENHDVEPDIDTLIKMADFFNTSVDFLIGHTDIEHVFETVNKYDLNVHEVALIENFRELDEAEKKLLYDIARTFYSYKH
ncbi:MAG: helix-turn-helix transcriptional regulator [Clostridia bacterium]|nr:helix-turn-helix transcriptional regulator [Clostridia bacterium]